MKPTRNQVYCPSAQKPKMLFSEKNKALNFIRFNYDEIYEESGRAPDRVYYCKACGGWHVTSKRIPVSNRKKMREMLAIAVQHFRTGKLVHCMRFLQYANSYKERIVRKQDADTESARQIGSMINRVYSRYMNHQRIPTPPQVEKPVFSPFLIHEKEGCHIYAINHGSMLPEEIECLQLTKGETVRNLFLHSLNIVDVIHDAAPKQFRKNFYKRVEDLFEGEIYGHWIQGRKLYVLVGSGKKNNTKYLSPAHLTYWIKIGDRTLRFFAGRRTRYACLFTNREIDLLTGEPVGPFRKKACA